MKTIKAVGKYAVSFNCTFGEFSCGEEDMFSLDHAGDDIDALATEVVSSDPKYPLTFKRVGDGSDDIFGVFIDKYEDVAAVMVTYSSI
jgi:hypothetical protein